MSQFARPANDISLGGWSGPAWPQINEAVPDDDAGYTEKTGSGTLEIGLSGVNDPGVGIGHIIRFRAKQQLGSKGPERLNCQLYEGGSLIAETGVKTLTRGSYGSFEYTLLETEADSIANYNNLRLRLIPAQGDTETMRLTWTDLKVPDAAAEEHSGSGSISGNGSVGGTVKKGGKGSALKSAGGVLLAIGLAGMLGAASMFGGGSQLAVGKKDVLADAAVAGGGSLVAVGQATEHSGFVIITGSGALAGIGVKRAADNLTIFGGGSIIATGPIIKSQAAAIVSAVPSGSQISEAKRDLLLIGNPDNIIFLGKEKPILISRK